MKKKLCWILMVAVSFQTFLVFGPVSAATQVVSAGTQAGVEKTAAIKPKTKGFVKLEDVLSALSERYGTHYAIAVTDLKTGKTISVNNRTMRSASIIKVYVMVAAFKATQEGLLEMDRLLPITKDVRVGGTGSLQGRKIGTKISVATLIEKMITESDNTASNMLVKALGFDYINSTIEALGANHTHLGYWFVLPPPAGVKNTTSVSDLNALFTQLYEGKCLGKTIDDRMIAIMKRNVNHSKLPALLPSKVQVAHKTGSIIRHEHDGGIVYSPGGDYVISVMGEDVPNGAETWSRIAKISKEVYKYYNP